MAIKRIMLMNVPLDILESEDDIDKLVLNLPNEKGLQQIVFLTLWDFLKARRNTTFRKMVINARLVLPVSKSLIIASEFLKLTPPKRRRVFDVIISFLNSLESHFMSIYIFGGRKETLAIAEKNVKSTFPSLKIVGRYPGFYPKSIEKDIVTAIVKSAPHLTIVSQGIKGGPLWINKNRDYFQKGFFVYDESILDIFAKNKKLVSKATFNRGLEYIATIFRKPWRILNIFRYFYFKLTVLYYKIFKS